MNTKLCPFTFKSEFSDNCKEERCQLWDPNHCDCSFGLVGEGIWNLVKAIYDSR